MNLRMRYTCIILFSLCSVIINGQPVNDPESFLRKKLDEYCNAVPREELYIHTDRGEYIAGEEIWSELYLFDRKTNSLTDSRTIVYIELINKSDVPVIRKRILVEKGRGPAAISLPDTLSTGRYLLRAYTQWMRNFLPSDCFKKELLIYNAMSDKTGTIPVPEQGRKKYASNYSDSQISVNHDFTLICKRNVNESLSLFLKKSNSDSSYPPECILLIQNHGNITTIKRVSFKSEQSAISIPEKSLLPGISQIVLFDGSYKCLCNKLVYKRSKESDTPVIACNDSVPRRSMVSVSLEKEEGLKQLSPHCKYSISVSGAASESYFPDIRDYIEFGTEYGSVTELLSGNDPDNLTEPEIDSLLEGRESSWIDWEAVLSGKYPHYRFSKEKDNHILTGRLLNKMSGAPIPGKNVFLSFPGKTALFQNSRTDSSGYFRFMLPVTDASLDIVIQPEEAGLSSSVMLMSSFCDDCLPYRQISDTAFIKLPDYLRKWSISYQVTKIYGTSFIAEQKDYISVLPSSLRFYGKPDIELKMVDYVKLPLMEEVFFELTPGVILKRKKNTWSMTMSDPVSGRPYEKDPVVMVDGVIMNDLSPLAALDPDLVEKIDVVKDLYLVDDYLFFGIVNVITIEGNVGNITMPEYAVRMKYRVAERPGVFKAPDYSTPEMKESRIPDFRNTLYWSPGFSSENNQSVNQVFWSSDNTGKYRIDINGINEKGQPFSLKRIIKVY
jgi:hypothetical protein